MKTMRKVITGIAFAALLALSLAASSSQAYANGRDTAPGYTAPTTSTPFTALGVTWE